MNSAQRTACITEVDQLVEQAREIKKSLDYLMSRQNLHRDPVINPVYIHADALVCALCNASDTLKQTPQGIAYVQAAMTSWYHFHVELDVEHPADPVFESVVYKGRNEWEIVMTTPTDGRQKAVVQSDGATWDQVYSIEYL